MTKPTKSKGSKASEAPLTGEPDEPLKLKKDAAEPGTLASRDTGTGKGDSAAMTGGVISPVDSTLVGKEAAGLPAAEPKAAADKSAAETKPDAVKAAGSVPAAKTDATSAKPADSPKDSASQEAKSSIPPTDARKSAPAEPAKPASAGSTPPASVQVRKTGFWPVAFGGIVAAGIGAAATIWALPNLPAGWLPEQAAPVDADAITAEAVSAATQAAEDAAAKSVEEAIANAPAAEAAALPEGIETMLDDHAQRIAALEEAGAASPAEPEPEAGNASLVPSEPPVASGDVPPAAPTGESPLAGDLEALQAQLEEQAAKIAELEARPVVDPDAIASVQALAEDAEALKEETAKLQEAAAEGTRRAQAVAAVAALQSALDKGVTAQEAQQALADAGMDAPEALQQDIPSLDDLQAGFGDASRAALRAEMASGGGGGNALTNFLKAQTGARSVAPREGDDADAVLSRANANVEAGDISAALTEMQTLPEAARQAPAMNEWLAGAQAYHDAQAALSDLTSPTN